MLVREYLCEVIDRTTGNAGFLQLFEPMGDLCLRKSPAKIAMISLPFTTRSLFLMNFEFVASSGLPSTAHVRANCASLPTTSINSPSVQRNTPAGMPPLPQVPRRGGMLPLTR